MYWIFVSDQDVLAGNLSDKISELNTSDEWKMCLEGIPLPEHRSCNVLDCF
jgi:D-ribose pyranose/furanose isomerase RbsD